MRRYKQEKALWWTRLGSISLFLAKQVAIVPPPLVVLSVPRSGSSWIGNTLGQAIDAMYLREPLTQSWLDSEGGGSVVFDINLEDPPRAYRTAAEHAFLGIPTFPKRVVIDPVQYPVQWSLHGRRRRRLVIKEVNPLAIKWLLHHYEPRVIYVVRHPAAVALSYAKRGWGQLQTDEAWQKHGDFQGRVHRFVLNHLKSYRDYCITQYETICVTPLDCFRDLYSFAGLTWSTTTEQFVQATTSNSDNDKEDFLSTKRNSRKMVDSWRDQISDAQLRAIQKGFRVYDLPWYNADDDW